MSHRSRVDLLVSVAPPLFIFVRRPTAIDAPREKEGINHVVAAELQRATYVDAAEGEVTLQSNKERSSEAAVDCILIGQR